MLVTSVILETNIRVVTPKELFSDAKVMALAESFAVQSGAEILITEDVTQGVLGVNVIYTDVWVSIGAEEKFKERINLLMRYQVNVDMINKTENKGNLIFLHCLPAFQDTNTQ